MAEGDEPPLAGIGGFVAVALDIVKLPVQYDSSFRVASNLLLHWVHVTSTSKQKII